MNEKRIAAGTYRGRGIAGSEQYGVTKNGHDQIVLELDLFELGESVSTFLYFSDSAAQYAIERLRSLGWEGDDLSDLRGIDKSEVDVAIAYEPWEGKERMRVTILTGGRSIRLEQQMDDKGKRAFGARFRDLAKSTRPAAASGAAGGDFPFGANAAGAPAAQAQASGRAKRF